jgi:beta-phosphoglucomutase-like phosphatase (HAD superfamily)
LKHYLKLLRISDRVNAVACGADVEHEKPAPDVIDLAIQRLPFRPSGAVVIGDTPYDARAA